MSGAVLKLEAVWRLLGGGDGSRGSFRLAIRRGALRSAAILRDLLVLLLRRLRAGRSRDLVGRRGPFDRGARGGARRRRGPGLRRGRRLLGESDTKRQQGGSNERGKGLFHSFLQSPVSVAGSGPTGNAVSATPLPAPDRRRPKAIRGSS